MVKVHIYVLFALFLLNAGCAVDDSMSEDWAEGDVSAVSLEEESEPLADEHIAESSYDLAHSEDLPNCDEPEEAFASTDSAHEEDISTTACTSECRYRYCDVTSPTQCVKYYYWYDSCYGWVGKCRTVFYGCDGSCPY